VRGKGAIPLRAVPLRKRARAAGSVPPERVKGSCTAKGVIVEKDSARQGADPHYGEPAKDDPHYGEGGEEKPDASDREKEEAIKRAKEHARESGEEASGKSGGESGGMASAY
jgi:hypothetical protein